MSNFNYDSYDEEYDNYTSCILCEKYIGDSCIGCPFEKFETKHSHGCMYWMRKIAGNKFIYRTEIKSNYIDFKKKDKDLVKFALKKLKEGAKKYIKWV